MTPAQLFTRCGQYLCGTGPRWKEQFAAMLLIKTNTVDNMSKGTSRVPPAMWREIAAYIRDHEREGPTLRGAALQAAAPDDRPGMSSERIGPAIIGAALSEKTIDEINRRLRALPKGHEFEEATLFPAENGGATIRMPHDTSREVKEGLKMWVAKQVSELGYTIDPFRTTNARNSFG
jgi:hypothetical protein